MKYRVYLSTKVDPKKLAEGTGIIVIEPDDYTDTQVKAIKAKGYKVLGYLSVGTIEKERSWWAKYKKYKLKQLEDWPDEWYVDVRKSDWRNFLVNRAKALKKNGYDGIWADNLDVDEYCKSHAMFNACQIALTRLQKAVGYVMVNGGSEYFDRAMDEELDLKTMCDGVTQEEVYSRIIKYSGKGTFGEQTADMHKWYKEYMKRLKENGVQTFLLEYTRDDALKTRIKKFCSKYKMTGYYISADVDL